MNEAPTFLKSSIRLAIAIIASYGFNTWSRELCHAFLQSEYPLRRTVYVRPRKGENIPERIGEDSASLWYVIKPQYCLSDALCYWWQTFRRWHVEDLKMKPSVLRSCIFSKFSWLRPSGDSSHASGRYTWRRRLCRAWGEKVQKLWVQAAYKHSSFPVQKDYCLTLQEVDFANSRKNGAIQRHFARGCGKIAYASTCTRPDASFENAQLSQVTTEQTDNNTLSIMNKTNNKLLDPAEIVYLPLLHRWIRWRILCE